MIGFGNQLLCIRSEEPTNRVFETNFKMCTHTQNESGKRTEIFLLQKFRSTWIKCKQNCDFINSIVVPSSYSILSFFSLSQNFCSLSFRLLYDENVISHFFCIENRLTFFYFASYWTLFILGYDFITTPAAELLCMHSTKWRSRKKNTRLQWTRAEQISKFHLN